jgi:hypothetical protein
MRARFPGWILGPLLLLLVGCGDDPTAPPRDEAWIIVWAHESERPVSGVRAEVLRTALADTTGVDGKVRFTVAPGEYTVRVHNTSSLLPPWFDHHVNLRRGDEGIIDADYCWSCE